MRRAASVNRTDISVLRSAAPTPTDLLVPIASIDRRRHTMLRLSRSSSSGWGLPRPVSRSSTCKSSGDDMSSPISTMASLSPAAMIKRRLSPLEVKIPKQVDEPRCATCLDGEAGPSKRLQCGHEYCVLCIAKHAQTKVAAGQDALCPCCMAPMQQSELKELELLTGFTLISKRCSSSACSL